MTFDFSRTTCQALNFHYQGQRDMDVDKPYKTATREDFRLWIKGLVDAVEADITSEYFAAQRKARSEYFEARKRKGEAYGT